MKRMHKKGFSLSVKATPQFSFLQNEDDNDNSMPDRKATFNINFGIGAGYTLRSGNHPLASKTQVPSS
jgi:hypothetical protein